MKTHAFLTLALAAATFATPKAHSAPVEQPATEQDAPTKREAIQLKHVAPSQMVF